MRISPSADRLLWSAIHVLWLATPPAGAIRIPPSSEPVPTVLILTDTTGSFGGQSRESLIAALSGSGSGVLVLEDSNDSTRGYSAQAAATESAILSLRSNSDVDPSRIGIWGEGDRGAWVATQVASDDSHLAFLVLVSTPMETPATFELRSIGQQLLAQGGLPEPVVDRITRFQAARWDYLESGSGYERLVAELGDLKSKPWYTASGLPERIRPPTERDQISPELEAFLKQRNLDPLESLSRVSCPTLVLFGDQDTTMPAAEFAVKILFLADALDKDLSVQTYQNLDHALRPLSAPSGVAPDMAPMVIDETMEWIVERVFAARSTTLE